MRCFERRGGTAAATTSCVAAARRSGTEPAKRQRAKGAGGGRSAHCTHHSALSWQLTRSESAAQVQLGTHDQRCGRREERAVTEGRMRMEREEPSATRNDLEAALACTGLLFRDECGACPSCTYVSGHARHRAGRAQPIDTGAYLHSARASSRTRWRPRRSRRDRRSAAQYS